MAAEELKLLDSAAGVLFDHPSAFNRMIGEVQRQLEMPYDRAVDRYAKAMPEGGTVRGTLAQLGVYVLDEDVGHELKLLDSIDQEVAATFQRDTAKLNDEPVDAHGRVLLAEDADVGDMLAGPEFERRLRRARRMQRGYEGDPGREKFRELDRQHIDGGVDLVRTLERPAEVRAANTHAGQVRRQLEQSFKGETEARAQVRQLDAEMAKLREKRDQAGSRTATTGEQAKRLRLLDQGFKNDEVLSAVLQVRVIDRRRGNPDEPYEESRRRVLEQAEPGCPLTLEDEAGMGPSDGESAGAQVFVQTDSGLRVLDDGGSVPADREFQRRLRARLLERGYGPGATVSEAVFTETLKQLLAEDQASA